MEGTNMKIQVIGLGYVGLPTAILLASSGHKVVGIDVNMNLIASIKNKNVRIEDEKLTDLFNNVISDNSLTVSNSITSADVHIIAVPTPVKDNKIELKFVESVCKELSKIIKKDDLVIVESTISPGTTEGPIRSWLESTGLKVSEDFYLTHIPERVQPGNLYNELVNNSRIVGGMCKDSSLKAKSVYESFVKANFKVTDSKTAETVKVVENTFRDMNIAFANEILLVCEKIGVKPSEVIEFANSHERVNILNPGPGVGGHCIPVDPWFLVELAPEESQLIKTARYRNDYMPLKVSEDIISILDKLNSGKNVGILGCSYKANSSDMRESPTKDIVNHLKENNINYKTYDPYFNNDDRWESSSEYMNEFLKDIDLIVVAVAHNEFKNLDVSQVKELTAARSILDCTGSINKKDWVENGFSFIKFGEVKNYLY
jgi:UDP-N-acetyl-D-mannosaminuronic acid dehydrogenase